MFNFERVHSVIAEEFGECGYEAIQSAVEFYLSNGIKDDFACEEDKLLLLMFLFTGRPSSIKDEFNPLYHFHISIDF